MNTFWDTVKSLLSLALDGVVGFMPRLLYPQGKSPGTYRIGGWVGPRVDVDSAEKREVFPLFGIEPRPYTNCDVYATNKTGSSSDDWIY
jgi:hypothetical protein